MAEYLRRDRLLQVEPSLNALESDALESDVLEGLCEVGSLAIEALIVLRLAQQEDKLSPEVINEQILEAVGKAAKIGFGIGQRLPQAKVADLNAAIDYAIMIGGVDFKKAFPASSAPPPPNLRR